MAMQSRARIFDIDVKKHQKFLSDVGQIIGSKGSNHIVHIPLRVGSPILWASRNAPGLLSDRQEISSSGSYEVFEETGPKSRSRIFPTS